MVFRFVPLILRSQDFECTTDFMDLGSTATCGDGFGFPSHVFQPEATGIRRHDNRVNIEKTCPHAFGSRSMELLTARESERVIPTITSRDQASARQRRYTLSPHSDVATHEACIPRLGKQRNLCRSSTGRERHLCVCSFHKKILAVAGT